MLTDFPANPPFGVAPPPPFLDDSIEVTVKTLSGRRITLRVSLKDSLSNLKGSLHEQTGTPHLSTSQPFEELLS